MSNVRKLSCNGKAGQFLPQATAARQQNQIETLTEGLQKVSAQLEAKQQVVNNL
jgi:hypothetical protein